MIDGPLKGRGPRRRRGTAKGPSCRGAPVLAPPIPPWGTPGVRPGISASPSSYAVHRLLKNAVSRVDWIIVFIFVLLQVVPPLMAAAQEPSRIWSEFVAKLKSGTLTAADIRAEYTTPEQQLVWLKQLKEASDTRKSWADWEAKPEVFRVGDHVQIVARVHDGTRNLTLCFTFLIEERRWYYSHMENIFIRLDQIGPPPVSLFPDIAEETKAWMREETYWSTFIGGVYAPLVKEKGADYVFNLLKDGPGYFVAAKTWVPFVPPRRAFILWLCWDQSRLRGHAVSLEKLDADEAIVKLKPLYFQIYKSASHLKTIISLPEYRRLFETIWKDRAQAAGWKVSFAYEDPYCLGCVLRFTDK
jgi:hypothetical protein